MFPQQGLVGARKEQPPAEFARSRPEIEDAICGRDRFGIMFDDEHGVAKIAQRLENINQPLRIARVQADGRLVEHVQGAHQVRPERRSKLDPLRLSARQRRR